MTATNQEPLKGDPKRQAVTMLKACEYQIFQTVSAWLDLRNNDVLFIEGAEDFDVVGDQSEAVQVKSSLQSISLGQKAIHEALNNFWILRKANKERGAKYKYLTRGNFAVEQGAPFGKGVSGLEIWQRQQLDEAEIENIRGYLRLQKDINDDLKDWLASASTEEIRKELIQKVSWETGAQDIEYVERGIYNKLSAFAEGRQSVPASSLKQFSNNLVNEVWRIIREESVRKLDRFLLEELWEPVAYITVSRSDLLRGNKTPVFDEEPLLRDGAPPLPGIVTHRVDLASKLQVTLAKNGLINIHASSRMGKTTLAKLMATSGTHHWKWWSVPRSSNAQDFERKLEKVAKEVARTSTTTHVVLDDLDFSPATVMVVEDLLAELCAIIKGRRGQIILTSHKPIPNRLKQIFNLLDDQILPLPKLNLGEIKDLAESMGCPATKREIWGKIILASTSGHAQLSAVRLYVLREAGWPDFSVDNFTIGHDALDEERASAQQLLPLLPPDHQEMLIRLSAFPNTIRRDHGIYVAGMEPKIQNPGIIFDLLIGPWLEPLHGDYFVLSPLLLNVARSNLTKPNFDKLALTAAQALISHQPCSTTEYAASFLLAWSVKDPKLLHQLTMSWIELGQDLIESIAEDLSWFPLFAVSPGQQLFEENKFLSFWLRLVQFRIATVVSVEAAPRILEAWYWEAEHYAESQHNESVALKYTIACTALVFNQVKLDAKTVVRMLTDLENGEGLGPELVFPELPAEIDQTLFDNIPSPNDKLSTFSFLTSVRCENYEYLSNFLNELEQLDPSFRMRIIQGFAGKSIEAELALDRVWLTEADLSSPDWKRCLTLFERVLRLAKLWNCRPLANAAIRASAVVLDEYVHDYDKAHSLLDNALRENLADKHIIYDRSGAAYFSQKDYANAELNYKQALDQWPTQSAPFDTRAAYAARHAALSSAHQQKWLQAATHFQDASTRLSESIHSDFKASLLADAGYCLWKSGDRKSAVKTLIKSWKIADTLPLGKEHLRAFTIKKTIGHTISWLLNQLPGKNPELLPEPRAGLCSDPQTPDGIKELPETENAQIWLLLSNMEMEVCGEQTAFRLGASSIESAKAPGTRFLAAIETISTRLHSGNIGDLPKIVKEVGSTLAAAREFHKDAILNNPEHNSETFQKNDSVLGPGAFLAALVVAHKQSKSWQSLLQDWRSCNIDDATHSWNLWFDAIEEILGKANSELIHLASTNENGWASNMIAAWGLLTSMKASPEELFLAHTRWLEGCAANNWMRSNAGPFCELIISNWLRVIDSYDLIDHRVNASIIKLACEGTPSLKLAAAIHKAAGPAVTLKLPKPVIEIIEKQISGQV